MILGLSFSSKLNKGSFIVHTFKTVSRILRVLVYSMKLLFFEIMLYLYKFNICACMEYCYHVWASNCSMDAGEAPEAPL